MIDKTHDPRLRSWVDSANRPGCDFPIQNLAVGVFQAPGESRRRLGVAIGDFILDAGEWLAGETLNDYLALPATQRRDLRQEWSRAPVRRPCGQLGEGRFGPTRELDYELELGAFLGPGNALGTAIPVQQAQEHIAGVCLVNDWSARDIQRWEYQPLGPFLSKNFATSLSPWIITMEALAPFRTEAQAHDVPVLPYLQEGGQGAIDITVEAWLRTRTMPEPGRLRRCGFKELYCTR